MLAPLTGFAIFAALFPKPINMLTTKLPSSKKPTAYVMSEKAKDYNAIDLVSGFSDFKFDKELNKLFNFYFKEGYVNYAPTRGLRELREIIAEKTLNRYGVEFEPGKEITVTAGATQGISTAITAFVKENDEVIVFDPSYDIYTPLIKLNGGIPVYVELTRPHYKIDWEELNRAVTTRTKLLILNNPHNPTGSVFGKADLQKLQKTLNGSKILVIADEVFEHFVYDGMEHESAVKYPELSNRSLIISSLGKTLGANGFRLGYCLAQEEVMREFLKFHQYMIDSVNTPLQHAMADFLKNNEVIDQVKSIYQEKRNYFLSLLEGSGFSYEPTESTYFQLLNFEGISEERDTAMANRLIESYGVAGVPLSAFYNGRNNSSFLRFSFMRNNQTLEQAAERLQRVTSPAEG